MQEISNNNNHHDFEKEIYLKELFRVLWQEKWFIISITAFVSIAGIIYSLSLPNIYESRAILKPANSSNSISQSLQRYSGLAGLAGISLPSGSFESNATQALEKLNSLSFFENNILSNIFLPDLMALKTWEYQKNKLNYDQSIYDIDSKTWVREYSFPQKPIPSSQESFLKFKNEHLILREDKETGFIFLSIKHQSPFVAKEWAELLVNQVNFFYREKDKLASETAVTYLNEQIAMTNLTEVKQAISQLLQEETKKLALIEANQNYVFDYIDPPAAMERKSEPKRSLICILSALLGSILSIFYVLIKYLFFSKRSFN